MRCDSEIPSGKTTRAARSARASRLSRTARVALAGATGLLLGGTLAACGGGDNSVQGKEPAQTPSESGSPSASASESMSASPSGTPSGPASVKDGMKAIDTAEKDVQGGKVFDLERDDDGGKRWQAKVATKEGKQFNLGISENGGRVVHKREDTTPDDDVAKLKDAKVSAKDAVRMAASKHSGDDLTSLEIDEDRQGTLLWQVNTAKSGSSNTSEATETETLIDAKSGTFLGEKTND